MGRLAIFWKKEVSSGPTFFGLLQRWHFSVFFSGILVIQ